MTGLDVLVPTCERPAALAVTLTALCAQSRREFRVVVSDQGERRPAAESGEVQAARRVLELQGRPVRILRHLPRRGIAEQRQFLLDQARAPLALFLDDDLILEPYVLELLAAMLEAEGCGFVGASCIGPSYAAERRPWQQRLELWEGPVEPEEVLPGTPAWRRAELHRAANLLHVQRRLGATPAAPRRYKVAWVSSCVLFDTAKLRSIGGLGFWRDLPVHHCGEDVLVQLRMMKAYGGCGVLPSGVYHQELPTTLPDRRVSAERALGWGGTRSDRPGARQPPPSPERARNRRGPLPARERPRGRRPPPARRR